MQFLGGKKGGIWTNQIAERKKTFFFTKETFYGYTTKFMQAQSLPKTRIWSFLCLLNSCWWQWIYSRWELCLHWNWLGKHFKCRMSDWQFTVEDFALEVSTSLSRPLSTLSVFPTVFFIMWDTEKELVHYCCCWDNNNTLLLGMF